MKVGLDVPQLSLLRTSAPVLQVRVRRGEKRSPNAVGICPAGGALEVEAIRVFLLTATEKLVTVVGRSQTGTRRVWRTSAFLWLPGLFQL